MSKKTFAMTATLVGLLVLEALAAAPVGWRTDGSGRYPDARPVTEWSAEKNVIWRTKMPSRSNATPVVLADRIFVCAEPLELVCVDKSDGKILWQKSNPIADAMTDEQKRQAAEQAEQAKPVLAKLSAAKRQLGQLNGELRKDPKNAELVAKVRQQRKVVRDLSSRVAGLRKWRRPTVDNTNGYSSPTPVSDGKGVWALFNNGVAACYDLAGNRKWIVHVDAPPHRSWGHSASPVLHDGKLIVHVANMKALDAATGKLLWTAEGTAWAWGTPVVTRIGDQDVAVTPKGQIVRLAEGKVLASGLNKLTYNSPVLDGPVAYHIQAAATAARLAAGDGGAVKVEKLWRAKLKNDRYYDSPVIQDGRIYAITRGNHLSILDAKDGKILNGGGEGARLDLGKGTTYPSIAAAGGHVFISSDNGTTAVLKPGPEADVVAKNRLDTFSSPVFEGGRMYVRTYKYLYCIGRKGEKPTP